jgi:hypothetical protein
LQRPGVIEYRAVLVICNDDKPFAFVSSGFDTTLDKEVYTVAVVARSPRRIGVEAIEDPARREWVEAVV